MEESDRFFLKRRNFESHLMNGLKSLYLERGLDDADVTLSAEEKVVSCHKWLLSLCSPYFNKLFRTNIIPNKSGNTLVILANIKFKDLENLVHFMYNGEVRVHSDQELQGVLQAGKALKIEGLVMSEAGGPETQEIPISKTINSNRTIPCASNNDNPTGTPGTGQTLNTLHLKTRQSLHKKQNSAGTSTSAVKTCEVPEIAKPTRYDVETSSVGFIDDNDGLNSYNTGQMDTLEQDTGADMNEGDDSLGNIGEDPLAFDEVELVDVKLEDVDYNTQDFPYEDDEVDEEDEQSGSEELAAGPSMNSGQVKSKPPKVPRYFLQYYRVYLSQLRKCFHNMTCVDCGLKVKSKYSMTRHFLSHVPPNFPCSICGLKLSNDASAYKHMKSVHRTTKRKLY